MLEESDFEKIRELLKEDRKSIKTDLLHDLTATLRGEFTTKINSHEKSIDNLVDKNNIVESVFDFIVEKRKFEPSHHKIIVKGENTDYIG